MEVPKTDEWAGKPVLNANHVNGLINTRLYNALKIGEIAPEFILTDANSGRTVSLSELRRDKPVVLFFASYSCTIAQGGGPDIARIAKRFEKVVDFVLIYIQEAQPQNGFPPSGATDSSSRLPFPSRSGRSLRLDTHASRN